MADIPASPGSVAVAVQEDGLRLRTVLNLRWLAIAGQAAAVLVGWLALGMDLPVIACFALILLSVSLNGLAAIVLPETLRLSSRYTTGVMLFDLVQLALLLLLTGGLTNPFSILIVGPVMIAATALPFRITAMLGLVAVFLSSILLVWYIPLRMADGTVLSLPDVYLFGMWLSLTIAVGFFGIYAARVSSDTAAMSDALIATQSALAREQQLAALGGVVAAAAHELGTPLATIKLAASELVDELDRDTFDPALADDARLIRDQADRCRTILAEMGKAGREDLHLRHVPIYTLIDEAAAPHRDRGPRVWLRLEGDADGSDNPNQPVMRRSPEIIHGLRNLIQNGVDFAQGHVWVDVTWDTDIVRIVVGDDGPGYAPDLLRRIGEPFVGRRRRQIRRGEYEGMGLGLFIAKALLERSGARLTFANGSEQGRARRDLGTPDFARPPGATVEVVWPRARVAPLDDPSRHGLARNPLNPTS
ncbi:sensor histidine kinase RegB [Pontivivens insulae]|uniref:histidine kinase n=1 Tax=Pontivivens insulae TaxID=1639689 RepID=A0A2R8AF24_9RHOB|nr:ActS/PrrB/RegB family redox-sensitive histidine kinase [Pontivivens insulae]RED12088.1 two-component system sensor histidine kinase RegB [Pontivivens insulae]SPF30844.1 Sensor histidine kinase RegB [Pontivivens insulae]